MNRKEFRWWEYGILALVISLIGGASKIGGPTLAAIVGGCAIIIWIGLREFLPIIWDPFGKAKQDAMKGTLVKDDKVLRFYQTTLRAWSAGKLSHMSDAFEQSVKGLSLDSFIKQFPPYHGSALYILFTEFSPLEGEYLIGLGNQSSGRNSGWFVLTNLRLIQKDGNTNKFKDVDLSSIDTYHVNETLKGSSLVIKMKTGQVITFEKVKFFPLDKYLSAVISKE